MPAWQHPTLPTVRFGVSSVTRPVHVHYDILAPTTETSRPPVMMVHGGGHAGSAYLAAADGRPGWAYRFAARGWPAILPDWPGCGRSGSIPSDEISSEMVCAGLGAVIEQLGGKVVVLTHSMSGAFGWKLLETHGERIAALVGVAPAPPGNIQPLPEILSETADTIVLGSGGRRSAIRKVGPNRSEPNWVADKLVGKSRFFPAERLATYASVLRASEGRLLYQRGNVRGSQVKVEDTAKLAGKRVLVLTGTEDRDHTREIDESIVTWLKGCGAHAEFLWLGDRGIVGNGHMLMLENNSDEIADVMLDWLERAVPG